MQISFIIISDNNLQNSLALIEKIYHSGIQGIYEIIVVGGPAISGSNVRHLTVSGEKTKEELKDIGAMAARSEVFYIGPESDLNAIRSNFNIENDPEPSNNIIIKQQEQPRRYNFGRQVTE